MSRSLRRWGGYASVAAIALLLVAASLFAVVLQRGPAVRLRTPIGSDVAPSSATGGERTFMTRDSVRVRGRQLPARSRGTVIIVHGLGEPDSLFVRWGELLRSSTEMNVLGLGLRGNGRSRDSVSRAFSEGDYSLDVEAVIRELRRRNPSGPLIALGTYGGLGILATYETTRRTRDLPAFDGIVVLHVTDENRARIPDNRPVTFYERRVAALDLLAKLRIRAFDGLEVATQSADAYGALATRWSYGSWRAADPSLAPLLSNGAEPATRTLVVSTRAPAASLMSTHTWVKVSAPVDLRSVEVQQAIARWSAEYAADAYEPVPPKATQTLDILRRP